MKSKKTTHTEISAGHEPTAINSSIHTLSPSEAAQEIAQGYRYRDDLVNTRNQPTTRWIWKLLELFGTSMNIAGDALAMTPISNNISQTIVFKNDANVIIIPYNINIPAGHTYDHSLKPIFPGDVSICQIRHSTQNMNSTILQTFRFIAISTDTNISPRPITHADSSNSTNFEIAITRANNRMRLSSVTILDSGRSVTPPANNMQYVSIRGLRSQISPSFGISVLTVQPAHQVTQTSGCTITFTPLGLRA
jgi:hypothetical protein